MRTRVKIIHVASMQMKSRTLICCLPNVMQCNVKLRKLLSAHKTYVRETSLFTGAIPNPVRISQTSRFVSVPGQNPVRSSRGDSVVLFTPSVRLVFDIWVGFRHAQCVPLHWGLHQITGFMGLHQPKRIFFLISLWHR